MEPKKVSLYISLRDLWNKANKFLLLSCVCILSIILNIFLVYCLNHKLILSPIKDIISNILQAVSIITGLTIGSFAFILSSTLPTKLSKKIPGKDITYFDELCANITITIIIQIFTILYAIFLHAFSTTNVVYIGFLLLLTIATLYLTFRIIINMYTTRDFLVDKTPSPTEKDSTYEDKTHNGCNYSGDTASDSSSIK